MKLGSYMRDVHAFCRVGHDVKDHWLPIDHERSTCRQLKLVKALFVRISQKLQFHRGLAFVTYLFAESDDRCDRVEEPPGTRRSRRV